MKSFIVALSFLTVLSVGCRSVEKMIDTGNFDSALLKSSKKIAGKENIKKRYVLAIEEAFKKATQNDMALVERNYNSTKAADWKRVINALESIEKRQLLVQQFLPVVASDGYKANFAFVKTTEMEKNAIDRFLEFTYRDATRHLDLARNNDKESGRTAYNLFSQLWEFSEDYLDGRLLQDEAKKLGMSHVLVSVVNATHQYIPSSLLDQVAYQNFTDDTWIRYYYNTGIEAPDREITIILDDLDIGPERIREFVYTDTRKIEDGFEYVLDKNGNVVKDSLGNDVKIAVFKNIQAQVIKIHQQKVASMVGEIINKNLWTGKVDRIPFDTQLVFEHYAGNFRGDRRALSADSRQLVGIAALPFPDDRQMVYDLMQNLHPVINDKIKRTPRLV